MMKSCIIKMFRFIYVCMSVSPACMYVYIPCACLVPTEASRGALDPLKLKSEVTMSCHVGAERQTQVLHKSNKYF